MNDTGKRLLPWGVAFFGLALLGIGIAAGLRSRSSAVGETQVRPSVRRRAAAPEPPPVSVEPGVSGEASTPVDATTMAKTAEAMDQTGLRYQTNRLRMAALQGDEAGRYSAAAGLKLYGDQASRFLKEETERESDPVVRAAFEEARKGLR